MKAHQSDKDADQGRVAREDLHGNRRAYHAANQGTSEHVPVNLPKSGSIGALVRLPAPEREVVVSTQKATIPAAPFAVGPHQLVVEHETYAICLDCQRHVGPCVLLKRKKRARLVLGFRPNAEISAHSAAFGGAEPPQAGVA
eukprot:2440266-Amphidinium_carterae.1